MDRRAIVSVVAADRQTGDAAVACVDVKLRKMPHSGNHRWLVFLSTPDPRPAIERVGDPSSQDGWMEVQRIGDRVYDHQTGLLLRDEGRSLRPV
jgi:hypothetical protein